MKIPVPQYCRHGFTLLELTVIMTAVALALSLASLILWGGIRLERVAAGNFQTLAARHALADQFRSDVTAATETPERWQDAVAGPTCLILRQPDKHVVVYNWHADRLERSEVTGDVVRTAPLGLSATRIEFSRGKEHHGLLTLQLFAMYPDGREEQAAEIMAALGGEFQ